MQMISKNKLSKIFKEFNKENKIKNKREDSSFGHKLLAKINQRRNRVNFKKIKSFNNG
jgi:hypothetical protein